MWVSGNTKTCSFQVSVVIKIPVMHFEQMADVAENEAKMAYRRPAAAAMDEQRLPSKGFVVREAPWTTANKKVGISTQVWCLCSNHLVLIALHSHTDV